MEKAFVGTIYWAIAFVMVAYAGGAQGVDGVKYLAALGGSAVLFVFVL